MLKTEATVEELCRQAVEVLSEHMEIQRAILFGSCARNRQRPDSDIDLAIISDQFEGMSAWEKIELLAKVPLAVDSRLELRGYTARAYEDPPAASMLGEIKRSGVPVYPGEEESEAG